jgi:hypothetical protein
LFREGNSSRAGTSKQNLNNTAVTIGWTPDGLKFAIGYENGTVQLKDKENDKELKTLQLGQGKERIWCLSFSSTKYRNRDYMLFVGTWEKNLYLIEVRTC